MARAADISFDDYIDTRTVGGVSYPPILSFVSNMPPYRVEQRVGGRGIGDYGHAHGVLGLGIGSWAGVVEFQQLYRKDSNAPGIGYVNAAIAEIAGSQVTFKVPLARQYGRGLVTFHKRSDGTEIPHTAVSGSLITAAGSLFAGVQDADGNPVDVKVLPGAYFTIDHLLYMTKATAGEQTVTTGAVKSVPEFPSGTGLAIELDDPYAVGRLPVGETIRPTETGVMAAGRLIPWEQAEDQ